MSEPSPASGWGRASAAYGVTAALSLLTAVLVLDLPHADLTVPFRYEADAVWNAVWVRGIIENGWFLHNPRLGAPGEQDMHDYPVPDTLHFFLLKLIALAFPH